MGILSWFHTKRAGHRLREHDRGYGYACVQFFENKEPTWHIREGIDDFYGLSDFDRGIIDACNRLEQYEEKTNGNDVKSG